MKHKLVFSAKPGQDPDNFVKQLDLAAKRFGWSDDDLFRSIGVFLAGKPLHWSRMEEASWNCYTDFVRAFLRQYSFLNYQDKLLTEAQSRMQMKDENIVDFLTSIRLIFQKMIPPLPLERQLDFTYRNLRHEYMDYIPRDTISSFETLMLKGKNWELKESYKRNQKSSTKLTNMACPEAWPDKTRQKSKKTTDRTAALYDNDKSDSKKKFGKQKNSNTKNFDPKKGQKDKGSNSNQDQKKSDQNQKKSEQNKEKEPSLNQNSFRTTRRADSNKKDPDKCFKCQESGHFFRDCENDGPDIFCYICGRHNVKAYQCPNSKCEEKIKLQNSENSKGGQR